MCACGTGRGSLVFAWGGSRAAVRRSGWSAVHSSHCQTAVGLTAFDHIPCRCGCGRSGSTAALHGHAAFHRCHECEACKIAVRRQTAITFAVRLPSATIACTRGACIVQASYSAVRPALSAGAGGHDIRSLLENSGPVVTLGELRYGAPCNRQGSARPTDRAGRPWRGASTAHPSQNPSKQPVPPFSPGGSARAPPRRPAAASP